MRMYVIISRGRARQRAQPSVEGIKKVVVEDWITYSPELAALRFRFGVGILHSTENA